MTTPVLRAGAAAVDITPPMGLEMAGYGWYLKRVCTEVLDPLYARALYLECGDAVIVLITADLCMVDFATRQAVANRLRRIIGLPEPNLVLSAIHTHSGPSAQFLVGWGERDPAYMALLVDRLVEAAVQARATAAPAWIGASRVRVMDVGLNRDQPQIALVDTAAQLLRVDRGDGAPLAVLYNFGAHAVIRYPFTSRISADWPGLVGAAVRSQMPGVVPFFLQAPCGNINAQHPTFDMTDPETDQKVSDMHVGAVALRFSDQIIPPLKSLRTGPVGRMEVLWKMLDLPCLPVDRAAMEAQIRDNQALADSRTLAQLRPLHERLTTETQEERAWRDARYKVDVARRQLEMMDHPPYVRRAPVQVIRLGDIVLVGWPAEVYVELGLEIRQRSPFPLTFVASFTNDTAGYIPTPAVYESRGKGNDFGRYPRDMTHQIYGELPYRSDVGRILVEETMGLLNNLAV